MSQNTTEQQPTEASQSEQAAKAQSLGEAMSTKSVEEAQRDALVAEQMNLFKKALKNLSKNDLIKIVIENVYILNVLQARVRDLQAIIAPQEYSPPVMEQGEAVSNPTAPDAEGAKND